ncbi:hypothetical protein F3Y22_tig00110569pilonHSYRG00002 [Hibiscus syriacus]|uniref:BZIP domain-containing protein n=1 Tax=Hibiscus syriacus TaxID=106335 RepID=A0A6A3A613_HIBSY|nr:hypothetical protein F3Y22_tig00110569pilonHSYRG00002 [Hibiscus syriacus]
MSGHDSKYFSTTKKGEIPELKKSSILNTRTTLLMNSLYTTVHFATYEAVKRGLIEIPPECISDERVIVHATADALAGSSAPVITTPLDSWDTEADRDRKQNLRYAPSTQLWRGSLHVMGGSKENRHTPGLEHWSLAVKDGKALETEWRSEVPIPRGGPHRACVVFKDSHYVIGGQEGDFMAKPGSPIFKCSRRMEVQLVPCQSDLLDESVLWNAPSVGSDGLKAIRLANNFGLNLATLPGNSSITVAAREWFVGDNQLWMITPNSGSISRRILSNRESARRSRKRKREHLADLEFQAKQLRGESDSLFKRLTNADKLCRDAGTCNRVLRSDVVALRNEVKLAEGILAGVFFACGLNQLVQNHMTSPQTIITGNNLRRPASVSPTVTVHGDGSSYVFGNSPNVHFSVNNVGISGDAVGYITQGVWPN